MEKEIINEVLDDILKSINDSERLKQIVVSLFRHYIEEPNEIKAFLDEYYYFTCNKPFYSTKKRDKIFIIRCKGRDDILINLENLEEILDIKFVEEFRYHPQLAVILNGNQFNKFKIIQEKLFNHS